jgi:5-methylcytosine-specific restriction endonuclease McrA
MFAKKVKSKVNAYGVAKIVRSSYSTVSGMTVKNSWYDLIKTVNKRDGGMCVICKSKGTFTKGSDTHHIIPLSKGGSNTMSNLITLCESCHSQRHNHLYRSK